MSARTTLSELLPPAVLLLACAAHAADSSASKAPDGISVAKTALGPTLVQSKGLTIYYYDLDQISPGESSCTGDCAAAWPPLAAAPDAQPIGEWKIIKREDGSRQWAYQGKPMYQFAGDGKPGDTQGDGVQRFWHAAKLAAPPPVLTHPPGVTVVKAVDVYILADYQGRALYTRAGAQGDCDAECAQAYPAFTAPALAQDVGAWRISTDKLGTRHWTFKGKPLFTYEGDAKPGDRAGELNPGWQGVVVD
jgi:predicted lipoprotein with Yx(FWY)xxD motif